MCWNVSKGGDVLERNGSKREEGPDSVYKP